MYISSLILLFQKSDKFGQNANWWGDPQGIPRSNGGVERVNQTIQKKLDAWMKENKTKHWSIGCKIAQWRYNTQVHQTLRDTPYHLTFGQHPRVGISNLPLSSEILNNLVAEANLNDVYSRMQCGMINDSVSETLDDAMFQDVIATVVEAIDYGITVAEAEDKAMALTA